MKSFKTIILFLLITLLSVTKSQDSPEGNSTEASTKTTTESVTSATASQECYRKLKLTGNTRSMFNIGPKVYLRYGSDDGEYNYFIYNADTNAVEDNEEQPSLIPDLEFASPGHIVLAASITGDEEMGKANNFMIAIIEMADQSNDSKSLQTFVTYRYKENTKKWHVITDSRDLPKFQLQTSGDFLTYSPNFWPKEVYEYKIEGFGYYSKERIFVITYMRQINNPLEIKYKRVKVTRFSVTVDNDWTVLKQVIDSRLKHYLLSIFEMNAQFYTFYIDTTNPNMKVARLTAFHWSKNDDELSYSMVSANEVVQMLFGCQIPELRNNTSGIKVIKPKYTSEPITDSPASKSNVVLIVVIFLSITIACILITVVVCWIVKKRKQEAAANENQAEPEEEQQNTSEVVSETDSSSAEVAADQPSSTGRESSRLSSIASRRSFVSKAESKAQ